MKLWQALGILLASATTAGAVALSTPAAVPATQALVQGVAHDALFGLAFDGARGLAAGAPGRILHTTDAGKSWKADTGFPSQLAMLGAALQGARALAVGQMGEVYVREGEGAWVKGTSPTTERLMNVSLNGSGLAVAVGAFGTVIKSTDGGKTWSSTAPDWNVYLTEDQLAQGIQPHVSAVQVSAEGLITIAGEFSLILRSSDGGASWKPLYKGEAAIFALDLRADGVGYAVGQDGLVLRTLDGGSSWTRQPAVTKANLLGVRSAGDQVLVSAMHDMLSSRDGGQSWQRVLSPDVQAAWYSGVGFSEGAFFAVGYTGRIVRVAL